MAYGEIIEWTVDGLRLLVQKCDRELHEKLPRNSKMKESLNHRDFYGIGSLTSSRLLLSLLSMITCPMKGEVTIEIKCFI